MSHLHKTQTSPKICVSTFSNSVKTQTTASSILRTNNNFSHTSQTIALNVTIIKTHQPTSVFSTLKPQKNNLLKISVSCNNICHQFVAESSSWKNQKRYYRLPTNSSLTAWVPQRLLSDPNKLVLVILLLLNLSMLLRFLLTYSVVFLMWNTIGENSRKGHRFMYDNFTTSVKNLLEGRVWTLITSCVSQKNVLHFALVCLSFSPIHF